MTRKPTAKQIRRERTPVPGESLRGLVSDSCATSGMTGAWPVLRHAGMQHRNRVDVAESDHLNAGRLAFALRVDEGEVVSRLHPRAGGSRRSVSGLMVPSSLMETRVRRFSPAAISGGVLHHPATHELRSLPFSTVGWDVLRSRCGCIEGGVLQGWTRTHGTARCDTCGRLLSSVEPTLVPEGWHDTLQLAADLAHHDDAVRRGAVATLPDALGATSPSALFESLRLVADCIHRPAAAPEQVLGLGRTEAMARACEALLSWPMGLRGLAPAAATPPSRWDAARREYLALDFPDDFAPASTRPSVRQTAASDGEGAAPTGPISAMAASRLSHVDEPALRQAWDEGRFTKHVRVQGGERVRAFDPAEVVVVAPTLRREAAIVRSASLLGLPVFGVEQLLAMRLMTPDLPDRHRNQAAVHLAAATSLATTIRDMAVPIVEDPIALIEAVRHVSGRPKPWGPVVAALLDGLVALAVDDGGSGTALLAKILVPRSKIPLIATLEFDRERHPDFAFAPRWSQSDALECLNGHKNSRGLMEGLEFSGGRVRLFDWRDVEERARVGVTTSDLARRFRLDPARAFSLLDRAAARERTWQLAPGLWERESAERQLRETAGANETGWLFDEATTPAITKGVPHGRSARRHRVPQRIIGKARRGDQQPLDGSSARIGT